MTPDQRLSRVWSLEYGATFSHQWFEPMHTKSIINDSTSDRAILPSCLSKGAVPNNRFSMGRLAGR